jgi:hypothetical protein
VEIASIDEGIHIDSSDEHPANADSPRNQTLQPSSKITSEIPEAKKQDLEIVSIEEGICIDRRARQPANAALPNVETRQSDVKVTETIDWQSEKQPPAIDSIAWSIIISLSFPRYRIKTASPESTTKSPDTRKNRFPSSTTIFSIPESATPNPVTWRRFAGRQIVCGKEQIANA